MRKEVLIAIIIGFGLGLVITFGIWTANKALKKETVAPEVTAPETNPISVPETTLPLLLTSPENETISEEETIEVSGQTAPEAIVVVLYQEGEKILEADEEGKFSTEITLAGGTNEIQVAAYDQEGNEAKEVLTIVYSTAEI